MTISRDMLAAAGRARRLPGGHAASAGAFLRGQLRPDGGFADRSGKSDLYYTVFGLLGLLALGEPPPGPVRAYLAGFGGGEALDLLHLGCLARCWSCLDPSATPAGLRGHALHRLAECRTPDGGYAQSPGQRTGSAYGCFLALGTMQDLGAAEGDPSGVAQCLAGLRTPDGAYANDANLPIGSAPATAAATAVLHYLQYPVEGRAVRWLLARQGRDGGFRAVPGAPQGDLLSTATTLHALALLNADLAPLREPALRFVHALQDASGGFAGFAGDPTADCEYTFYGLLALGRLSG